MYYPQDGLPGSAVVDAGDAGLPEDLRRFPAMVAIGTAKDDGFAQVAEAPDAHFNPVDGDIQGMGDMPLIKIISRAEVDDHRSFVYSLPEFAISKSEYF